MRASLKRNSGQSRYTENFLQCGYDENDNNMSNETKRETNYSINNNTRYMQLTKYNKYTNDDI